MAVKPPSLADFFPAGKTLDQWKQINNGVGIKVDTVRDFDRFVSNSQRPGTVANEIVKFYGSPEAYRKASQQYDLAYANYVADFRQEQADKAAKNPTASQSYVEVAQRQADEAKAAIENVSTKQSSFDQQLVDRRQNNYNTVRSQLETQYNNLVKFDPRLAYQGRSGDLPAIFNQQANQLVDAGVTDISKLRNQNGRLVDVSTGKVISTTNLNGQITTDRDTGVQKWGDIFSGVKGGANYGVQFAEDGSPIFFPAWEKSKSPIAQIGLGGLESVITPLLTIGGAMIGIPGLGAVGGAAAGAAVGSTAGQLLASGEVDWEKVALSAGVAGGGAYLSGAGAGSATADLSGTTTGGMLGPDAGFAVAEGAGSAAAGVGAGAGGLLADDAAFIAENAKLLSETGISSSQIAQTLVGEGINPNIANSAANLATTGTSAASIANTLAEMGSGVSGGLFSATPADIAAAGITTGGTGISVSPEQLAAIQRGEIPGATFAEQVENAKFILPGTGATGTTNLPSGVTGVAKDALSSIFGEGGVGDFLTNLAGAGIDYAALKAISDEAQKLGRETEARATAAGAAANVPFTPYTVTTGAGSTAFGTGPGGQPTATVTASPEYQALRDQAISQAGSTLGAINPQQAAESLFQRSEALAAPARQRETEQLLSSLGARGLLGMSTNVPTVGGTTAGVNPYVEALASAQRSAQAKSALESTMFGTAEAQRQAALANALIGTGQGIDTAALSTLIQGANLGNLATSADQVSAGRQLGATLGGLELRQKYEDLGLRAQSQGYLGAADFGKGMLGLPTQPGNTSSNNILGNLFNKGIDYIFS